MIAETSAITIQGHGMHYQKLNALIRREVERGASEILVTGLSGQRYIGAGLKGRTTIILEGVPGNDLACFMDGSRIVVRGNAQDCVANTMSSGEVIVHGDAGDVLAYGMRGGKLFIKGNAGYRVGIHMKEFRKRIPLVIIGGGVRDYLGEYMAGGTLVVLGFGCAAGKTVGAFVGTGMHGGQILVRGDVPNEQLGSGVERADIPDSCWSEFMQNFEMFCREFNIDQSHISRDEFTRLVPVSHRPYGKMYVA